MKQQKQSILSVLQSSNQNKSTKINDSDKFTHDPIDPPSEKQSFSFFDKNVEPVKVGSGKSIGNRSEHGSILSSMKINMKARFDSDKSKYLKIEQENDGMQNDIEAVSLEDSTRAFPRQMDHNDDDSHDSLAHIATISTLSSNTSCSTAEIERDIELKKSKPDSQTNKDDDTQAHDSSDDSNDILLVGTNNENYNESDSNRIGSAGDVDDHTSIDANTNTNSNNTTNNSNSNQTDQHSDYTRNRWIRINRFFHVLMKFVTLVFYMLQGSILICWVVFTGFYVVSLHQVSVFAGSDCI